MRRTGRCFLLFLKNQALQMSRQVFDFLGTVPFFQNEQFLILPEAQLEKGGRSTKAAASFVHVGIFPVVRAPVRLGGASRGCPFLGASRVDQGRPGAQDRSLLQGPPGRKAGIRPLLGRPPADLGLICAIPQGRTAILRRLLSVQRFALQASCSLVPLSGGRLHLKVALGFSRSKVAAVTPEELPCGLRARAVEKERQRPQKGSGQRFPKCARQIG